MIKAVKMKHVIILIVQMTYLVSIEHVTILVLMLQDSVPMTIAHNLPDRRITMSIYNDRSFEIHNTIGKLIETIAHRKNTQLSKKNLQDLMLTIESCFLESNNNSDYLFRKKLHTNSIYNTDGTCVDTADCLDNNTCLNKQTVCTDQEKCTDAACLNAKNRCSDSDSCKDNGCINSGFHLPECTDNECEDNECFNQPHCTDENTCSDYSNCTNEPECTDNLCSNSECNNNNCANSNSCNDVDCVNQKTCSDTTGCSEIRCTDLTSCDGSC
jgi:hypothetical protein